MRSGNALLAELWGLRLGIQMAMELNLSRVIFEMDSAVVVQMVKAGGTAFACYRPLLQEIFSLLNLQDWSVSVVHVFREANCCADLLANMGRGS